MNANADGDTGNRERRALVLGNSLGALAAAVILRGLSWQVFLAPSSQPRGDHPIVVNATGRYLLDRICGAQFLAGVPQHRLTRRRIVWRRGRIAELADDAIVVGAAVLKHAMAATASARGAAQDDPARTGPMPWTFVGAAPDPRDGAVRHGGKRSAAVAPVALRSGADDAVLTIEAGAAGWAALVPTGQSAGALFAFGTASFVDPEAALDAIVADMAVIPNELEAVTGRCSAFAGAPRLHAMPWPEGGTVLLGNAALAFDPLCGDGTAVALRTAHLAAVLAEACASGADAAGLRAFYARRLALAMRAHLRGLSALYAEAPFCAAWKNELGAMHRMSDSLDRDSRSGELPLFAIAESGLHPMPANAWRRRSS